MSNNEPSPTPEGRPESRSPSAADLKQQIALAKRDFAGFIEGEQPNITDDQLFWLSFRMSQPDDESTFIAMEAEYEDFQGEVIWQERLRGWRADPVFSAVEMTVLGNKREGFRLLSVHMAGRALRRMNELLDSKDPKIVIRALTLWSRQMGLLIDKINVVSKDDLMRLAERMNAQTSITPIPGPSIEGEWTELPQSHSVPDMSKD